MNPWWERGCWPWRDRLWVGCGFRWYDLWVGVYISTGVGMTHIYVCPLPTLMIHFVYHHRMQEASE